MKTAIMTDSNSGISSTEARERGMWSIDMPILIDGQVRYEGIDLTHEEFFELLESGANVSTSQPAPGAVCAMWDDILSQGYDEIVYIPMTAGLSQSCQSAQMTAAEYEGRVRVVDNRRISVTQRMSVLDAERMAKNGVSATEIRATLEQRSALSRVFLAVDTLEYLVRGGRTTPAAAALGSILKVKPVLSIQTERIEPFSKERGMGKAIAKMFSSLHREMKKNLKCKTDGVIVGVAGAGISQEKADEFLLVAREQFPGAYVFYNDLPLSIATHTGPGALGMGIQPKFE